jgi:Protein CHAPERONE-LIKE PROTEIN OF POR1-like
MMGSSGLVCATLFIVLLLNFHETSAFTTTSPIYATTHKVSSSSVVCLNASAAAKKKRLSSSSSSSSSLLSNPFKKLPWNVQKEKERQARRLKQERNILHRQLGIAEDATYEEIVDATNLLIAKCGPNDLKAKIKIEVAKDKILQIRLNERLAGLTLSETNREARAQSSYEVEG